MTALGRARSATMLGGQLPLPSFEPPYRTFAIDDHGQHGEIFTRPWVVDLILDMVGYTPDRLLHRQVLVEPACGSGAFLVRAAARVSSACRASGEDILAAAGAIRAYDLLPRNVLSARARVAAMLAEEGWDKRAIDHVVSAWITARDFLLSHDDAESADFVVGNPPYIRLEDIPSARSEAYRHAWPAMAGRADIYVGFIEKGLSLLRPEGRLGFICADRWMKNQYGAGLRQLIADTYAVDAVVTMHDVDAFETDVSAYPAITVLANRMQGEALVVETKAAFDEAAARELVSFIRSDEFKCHTTSYAAARLPHWYAGRESWPQGTPERLAMIEYLTDNFGPLEDPMTGTRVGIGVATGADRVYIVDSAVDVESERLLPLAMTSDLATGQFVWSGRYLVNPWNRTGVVDLSALPKLESYFNRHQATLRKRHVAGRKPHSWYQTIDRVDPDLLTRPKLLIQDMRQRIFPVLDDGSAYPHHNLYYVVSDQWDPRVLGGLLMSDVANAFVEAFAVKMRGGTLRFQAQYLRRIRVPRIADLTAVDRDELADAFVRRDQALANRAALRVYGLAEVPR